MRDRIKELKSFKFSFYKSIENEFVRAFAFVQELNDKELAEFKYNSETAYFDISIKKLESEIYISDNFNEEFHYEDIVNSNGEIILQAIKNWIEEFEDYIYTASGEEAYDKKMIEFWRKKGA